MPVFVHRLFSFTPSKPRNPLLKLAWGLLGLMLLVVLLVFGLFIGIGMLVFAGVRRMLRAPTIAPTPSRIEGAIDGEFSVIDKNRATLSLR